MLPSTLRAAMFVDGRPSPLVLLTDWRTKSDQELDLSEPDHKPHVLHCWRLGREILGPAYYRTQRIALFEVGATPTRLEVSQARATLRAHLHREQPKRVVVLPTPDAQLGEAAVALSGTACWSALGAPDSLDAMRLTHWDRDGIEIVAGWPIARRSKQLQLWAMGNGLRRAASAQTLMPNGLVIHPGQAMLEALGGMAGRPIAVDLEFIPSRDCTTAVGLSDGTRSVSVPWSAYRPAGSDTYEPGLFFYPEGSEVYGKVRNLLAAPTVKYCHNFVADVPRLERMKCMVTGPVLDTFAAHSIAYPELRHGLQVAVASVLPVPPWKSLFRPRHGGWTRADEEFYIADPLALRDYNARDAFYTWHLAQAVMPEVGLDPTTGEAS